MTSNIATYMLLAEQCVQDARLLAANESYRSACNRAYYGYFDAIRALLASRSIATKSHSSIRMLFGEHFVRNGPFTKSDATAFHKLFLLRQSSDYDPDESISAEDALEAIDQTAEFVLQVGIYLRASEAH